MSEKPEVTEARLDMLKEMANVGVGNAVTSLSTMLNEEQINMKVPQVAVESIQEIPDYLGSPEDTVGAVYFEAQNQARNMNLIFLFVLSLESVRFLIKKLLPPGAGEPEDTSSLGEMELSLLREVGNIVIGSYLNALSFMTGTTFLPSSPQLAIDMAGAIVATVIAETRMVDDNLIFIKTNIGTEKASIEASVLILPDQGALTHLFKLMGAE